MIDTTHTHTERERERERERRSLQSVSHLEVAMRRVTTAVSGGSSIGVM